MLLAETIAACSVAALLLAGSPNAVTECVEVETVIPDGNSSASVTVTVPADPGATVESVAVSIDLEHEWLGDLTISVSHLGESVVLVDRIGTSTWSFGCGGDDIDATFTESATVTADSLCDPGGATPMLFGDLVPAEPLSAFQGLLAEGDWIVIVTDHNQFDTGVIQSVCITIVTAPVECPGDVTGNGSVDLADLNLVLANFGSPTTDGDADGSGSVDLADLNLVLANFGGSC